MITTESIITDIIRRESPKYTNDPLDSGGPTKYGITQRTLAQYRGRPVTADEVRVLEEPEVRLIYRTTYVEPFSFIKDEELKALLADCAVLHGQRRAVQWLQKAVGTAVDGVLGPETRKAGAALDGPRTRDIQKATVRERVRFIANIVQSNPSQVKWLEGWLNRAMEFI